MRWLLTISLLGHVCSNMTFLVPAQNKNETEPTCNNSHVIYDTLLLASTSLF